VLPDLGVHCVFQLFVQQRFEGVELWLDDFGCGEVCGDRVGGLQTVAGDTDDGCFVLADAALLNQLGRDAYGYAARGLREMPSVSASSLIESMISGSETSSTSRLIRESGAGQTARRRDSRWPATGQSCLAFAA